MATIGSLVTSLSLESAAFQRGLHQARQSLDANTRQMRRQNETLQRSFSQVQTQVGALGNALRALAGVLAVRQFSQWTRGALDAAGGLGELAASAGVTTRELQELSFAGAQAGVSQETMVSSLQRFSRRMGEAAQGTGTLVNIVKQYGISLEDTQGNTRQATDVIGDLAEAMKGAKSQAEQVRIATQAFGRAGASMVPILIQGREGLEQFAAQANAVGAVLSDELIAKADRASDTIAALQLVMTKTFQGAIVESFAGSVSGSADAFQRAADAGRMFGQVVGESMRIVVDIAGVMVNNIDAITAAIATFASYKAAVLFLELATAIKAAGVAMLTLNGAMLANPIGIIAAAIAAAVGALVLFRNETINVGDATVRVGELAGFAWGALKTAIYAVIQEAANLALVLASLVSLDFSAAAKAFDRVGTFARQSFDDIKASWADLKSGLAETPDLLGLQDSINRVVLAAEKLGPAAVKAGTGIEKLTDAQRKEAAAREAYLSDMKQLHDLRITTIDDLGREVRELQQITTVHFQGEEAVRSLTTALQIENQVRELGLGLYSEEGRLIADLIEKREELKQVQVAQEAFTDYGRQIRQLEELKNAYRGVDGSVDAVTQSIAVENELRQRGIPLWQAHESGLYDTVVAYQALKSEVDGLAEAQQKAQEESTRTADLMLEPFKNAIQGIQDSFTSMFEGIFSGGIDSFTDLAAAIKRIFIRLAAEIATLMVIRPVLGNVLMSAGMGGIAQQMGMVGGGGLSAMGPLGATMSSGFSTVTNAINNLGTNFGFAARAVGPAAAPWAGAPGGFNFAAPGRFGGQTLGGFLGAGGIGAGLGALGGSMFGLSKQGTIGSSIGGGLGGALGSIIPGVGTLAGGLGGSVLGGLFGSLFKTKPSDKGQASEINLLTGAVKEWGQTGKKFSQENRAAATTFASSAAQLADTLKALTGGTLSGGLRITVGSREGMRVGMGDQEFGRTKDPKEFASLITQAIASSLKGVGGIQGQILKRADMSTPESLIADLEFGRVFEELTRQARPLTDQLNALKEQFSGARAQARRLGLDVGLLKDRQKEAVAGFRGNIMTELRGLAGDISPMSQAFNELRDRFRAVRLEAKAIGINPKQVQALQQKALGNFREGILNELRGVASGANSVVQAFQAMREQFRAVRRDARAIGLSRRERDEVKDLQKQAIGNFRQGIMTELRSLAGAATPAIQAFKDMREQFKAARRDARAIGFSRGERNEIQSLQQQAIRSFRQGIMTELKGLASDATPAVQAFKDLRAQFRAANRDAKAIGLNRGEIRRLRDQAISNFRKDFITNLEQSAGGPSNFVTQMEELTKHFAQARKDARGIGVGVGRVNQIQARAVENLQTSFMDSLRGMTGASETFADQIKALADRFALAQREARALGLDVAEIRRLEAQAIQNLAKRTLDDLQGQLAQQAQAMRDHFRGILDPLRDFRRSLDFGSLSANAPAQQFQLAQSQFQLLAQQAANNNAKALSDLPRAAQAFIEQAQQFGASPAHAQAVKQVQQVFDRIIAQQEKAETEFTRDLPDAIDDSAEKQVKALRQEVDRLVSAINEVTREMQRSGNKRVA